ncbi:MAG TPA: hypothetical protein VIC04_04590, partial [Terriglobia bacterium]
MNSLANPETVIATQRVYSQNREAAALLSAAGGPWEPLLLPAAFPGSDPSLSVVIGDDPSVFTPALRRAIEGNQTRLIYILRGEPSVPREAKGTAIFSFLTLPLHP